MVCFPPISSADKRQYGFGSLAYGRGSRSLIPSQDRPVAPLRHCAFLHSPASLLPESCQRAASPRAPRALPDAPAAVTLPCVPFACRQSRHSGRQSRRGCLRQQCDLHLAPGGGQTDAADRAGRCEQRTSEREFCLSWVSIDSSTLSSTTTSSSYVSTGRCTSTRGTHLLMSCHSRQLGPQRRTRPPLRSVCRSQTTSKLSRTTSADERTHRHSLTVLRRQSVGLSFPAMSQVKMGSGTRLSVVWQCMGFALRSTSRKTSSTPSQRKWHRSADELTSRCHYTSTDLVCTTKTGAIFIVRHYKDVFSKAAEMPEPQRATYVKEHTIIIGLGTVIRQLTTYRDHIVLCTVSYFIFCVA